MILLFKLLVLEIFILGNAVYDYHRIVDGRLIRHDYEALVRGIVIVILALVFNWSLSAWKDGLFFMFWFWQYDYVLNYLRHKPWWYLGNNFFDKILKGKNLRYHRLGLKALLVLGSLILLWI